MSDVHDAAARIRDTTSRLDAYLAERAEQERRREQDDRRSQEQIDAQTRRDLQIKYDSVFEKFEERAPAPEADQSPASYQRHLMRTVQRKLSPADERVLSNGTTQIGDLARAPVGEMTRSVREMFEPQFFEAGMRQAEHPHVSTLPPEGFVERVRVDENTGVKERLFFGRNSFIKDFSEPGKHVVGFRLNGVLTNTSGVPVVLRQR